jgi:hypothetical protein
MIGLGISMDPLADWQGESVQGYLGIAAKIVETVAFEVAEEVPAHKVQDLLALVCAIEAAAEALQAQQRHS